MEKFSEELQSSIQTSRKIIAKIWKCILMTGFLWLSFSGCKQVIVDPEIEKEAKEYIGADQQHWYNGCPLTYESFSSMEIFRNDSLIYSRGGDSCKQIGQTLNAQWALTGDSLQITTLFGTEYQTQGIFIEIVRERVAVFWYYNALGMSGFTKKEGAPVEEPLVLRCRDAEVTLSFLPQKDTDTLIFGKVNLNSPTFYEVQVSGEPETWEETVRWIPYQFNLTVRFKAHRCPHRYNY